MTAPLPVVIVGAGIVGVSTALWLQRAGRPVVIVDREGPAAGASQGNAGVLAAASVVPVTTPGLIGKAPGMLWSKNQPLFLKYRYLPKLAPWLVKYLSHCNPEQVKRIAAALGPLTADSLIQHRALSEGTDAASFVSEDEYVFAYNSKAHYQADQFGWDLRRDNGFEWVEQSGADYASVDPVFGDRIGFVARCLNHGRISDPGQYVRTLASHAEKNGARLVKGSVNALDIENGIVKEVRVEGQSIPCAGAVVSTGVWSGPLAKQLGVQVPLESERGYHLEFWEPSEVPVHPTMLATCKAVATPMEGRLRIAGAVEFGGTVAPASVRPLELLRENIERMLPNMKYTKVTEWMGHRPAPADSIPIIGAAPGVSNAWLAFGHHHVGLTTGPKTGRLIAQLITGEPTAVDLMPYNPSRFSA